MITPKLFLTTLNAQWQATFTYPGMLVVWMLHTFFTPFTMLIIWTQLSHSNQQLSDSLAQITYFYLILPLAINLTGAWQSTFLANKIRTGELNTYLTKPFHHIWLDLTNNLAEKGLKTIFLLPMILVGLLFYHPDFTLSVPLTCLAFLVLVYSAALTFVVEQWLGYLAFWLDDISGINNFNYIGFYMFGGLLLPTFLYPPWLQQLAVWLPFRYYAAFPVEIFSHSLNTEEILTGLVVQTFYFGVFALAAVWLWRQGVKKYAAFGG